MIEEWREEGKEGRSEEGRKEGKKEGKEERKKKGREEGREERKGGRERERERNEGRNEGTKEGKYQGYVAHVGCPLSGLVLSDKYVCNTGYPSSPKRRTTVIYGGVRHSVRQLQFTRVNCS